MPALKNGHIPQLLATEYASYRDEVIEVLSSELAQIERTRSRKIVLYDPMAGTAPLLSLAEARGYTAYFNDLNSLHLYVNAAKTYQSYLHFIEIGPIKLLSMLCEMASKLDRYPRNPTEKWIEGPVLKELMFAWKKSEEQSKTIAVLIKAIILLSVRNFSSFIRTTNPTWLKPGGLRPKIPVQEAFQSAISRLDSFYQHTYTKLSEIKGGRIILTDYDSSHLVPDSKVDVVITSPPFCNRVDWDRMYAPEHFFLKAADVWHTKTEFLGTTAVHRYPEFDSELEFVAGRSDHLRRFLGEVRKRQLGKNHESDYYVKYFTRYFAGLFRAFDMAANALGKDNAGIYFVVQENSHRGLRINIGQALAESLCDQGFRVLPLDGSSWDRHHLGLRNVSKRYRLISPKQQESIWHAIQ